jgi:hypothetical protein
VEKFVKAHIRRLRGNSSSEDIIVAFQELDHDIVKIKQITPKRSTPAGVTHISLPFFLVTLTRNKKLQKSSNSQHFAT